MVILWKRGGEPWRKSSRFSDRAKREVQQRPVRVAGGAWGGRGSAILFAELGACLLASRAGWLGIDLGEGVPWPAVRVMGTQSAPNGEEESRISEALYIRRGEWGGRAGPAENLREPGRGSAEQSTEGARDRMRRAGSFD